MTTFDTVMGIIFGLGLFALAGIIPLKSKSLGSLKRKRNERNLDFNARLIAVFGLSILSLLMGGYILYKTLVQKNIHFSWI
ncbi:MAG: hypothetical protein VXY34_10000 [Bdellovibrionota bacterium]|jgi:Na+-driven multidrug efflux pump|nr:hypothetical protein [Bdellovibrionota bacterium]MEC8625140.1 hypothetical protein [Bdellovibrionota bacterium]